LNLDPVEPWIAGNAARRLAAQLLSSPSGSEIADSPDAGFGPGFEGFTSSEAKPSPNPEVSEESSNVAVAPSEAAVPRSAEPVHEVFRDTKAAVPQSVESVHQAFKDAVAVSPPSSPIEVKEVIKKDEAAPMPFLAAASAAPSTPVAVQKDESELLSDNEEPDHPFQSISKPVANSDKESKRGPLMERMMRFREWLMKHAKARSVFVLDREGQPVLDDPAYAKLHFLARSLSQAYRPVPGQPGNVHVKVGSDAYLVVIPVETDFGCLVLGTVLPRPLSAPSVEIVAKALVDASKPRRT